MTTPRTVKLVILVNGIGHSKADAEVVRTWQGHVDLITSKVAARQGECCKVNGEYVPNYGVSAEVMQDAHEKISTRARDFYENTQTHWALRTLMIAGAGLAAAAALANIKPVTEIGLHMFVDDECVKAIAKLKTDAGIEWKDLLLISHSHGAFVVNRLLNDIVGVADLTEDVETRPQAILLGSPLVIPGAVHVDNPTDRICNLRTNVYGLENNRHVVLHQPNLIFPLSHEMSSYMSMVDKWLP